MAREVAIVAGVLAAVLFLLGFAAATSQLMGVVVLWTLSAVTLLVSIGAGIRASLTVSLTQRRRGP